jgi:hypothetical protein
MLETGDIILFKGTSWLSRQIQKFMLLMAKKFNIKHDWIGNHAGTYMEPCFIGEAVMARYKINEYEHEYGGHNNYVVLSPRKSYTRKEKDTIQREIINLSVVCDTYQFWNFIQWPLYIWSNGKVNLFKKDNKWAVYCYEAAARVANKARPNTFAHPERTSWFDLYDHKDFYIKIDKRKL